MNLVRAFSSEAKHALFISEEGDTYIWGYGHTETPEKVTLPKINGRTPEIISSASGMYHAIALTRCQHFLGFGSNNSGQLGEGKEGAKHLYLLKIKLPEEAERVVAGATCTGAITTLGSLFMWGTNESGQLGVEATQVQQGVPAKVDIPEPVIDYAGGLGFSLALTKNGKVYGFGDNEHSQLGAGPRRIFQPALVPLPSGMVRIYAGCRFAFGLTKKGALVAWGCNLYGSLGTGDTQPHPKPEIVIPKGVEDVACGWGHCMAIMDDGAVMIWGTGFDSQLGCPETFCYTPKKLIFPEMAGKSVASVGCGFSQGFFLTDEGSLYMWGAGGDGQLGNGKRVTTHVPTLVPNLVFRSPWGSEKEWNALFFWLFLGHGDQGSVISLLPIEVLYNFVEVVFAKGGGRGWVEGMRKKRKNEGKDRRPAKKERKEERKTERVVDSQPAKEERKAEEMKEARPAKEKKRAKLKKILNKF
jgi:alpha-tubulin suppressor-like RCC1 family protein